MNENLPNILSLIENNVSKAIIEILLKASVLADNLGVRAYLVGGFVRDILLGKESSDIDIVIEGDCFKYGEFLSEYLEGKFKKNKRFLTGKIFLSSGLIIDIATARTEYYESIASLPFIEKGDIKTDMFRRDFTINALAISLNQNNFSLLDFFNGLEDLNKRILRALHKNSFNDDPTRIFRGIRLQIRYGFSFDEETNQMLKDAVEKGVLNELSCDRLRNELFLILNEKNPEENIKKLLLYGIFDKVFPGNRIDKNVLKKIRTGKHLIKRLKQKKIICKLNEKTVLLLILFKNHFFIEQIVSRLNLTKSISRDMLCLKKYKNILEELKTCYRPSKTYEILNEYSNEFIVFLLVISNDLTILKHVIKYLKKIKNIHVTITGHTLKKMGYKPGPRFKMILNEVLKQRIDGEINSKEEEIKFVRKLLKKYKDSGGL